jgi:DNA polymerase-3 subunit chi
VTRVDFYILTAGSGDRFGFTCRLVEKVFGQGHRIYIHTGSAADARHLDRLLWTFRDQSFIPHGLADRVDTRLTPVLLGHDAPPPDETDVLINLTPAIPGFFSRFQRLLEIVEDDPRWRAAARDRWRHYRQLDHHLENHVIQ